MFKRLEHASVTPPYFSRRWLPVADQVTRVIQGSGEICTQARWINHPALKGLIMNGIWDLPLLRGSNFGSTLFMRSYCGWRNEPRSS